MNNLERKVDTLIDFLIAEDEQSREDALRRMKELRFDTAHEISGIQVVDRVRIDTMLRNLGVPPSLIGYEYLRRSIELVREDSELVHAVTKQLYPKVAKEFNTTASRVDRSMRHAISVCWDRGEFNLLSKFFGSTVSPDRGYPTNSEFISQVVLHLVNYGNY